MEELHVLLVEDNVNDAMLIQRELSHGWDVTAERVETEKEVRNALHTKPWDAVLCDYAMPNLNPQKVIDILDEFGMDDTPFVLVTGTISEVQAEKLFFEEGVDGFVNKDRLPKLILTIRRMLKPALVYNQTLKAWARALEFRDKETQGHSERVTELTVNLARAMKVSETQMIHIRRGAYLHDIGKMGISDQVLLKPGKLSESEMQRMRLHPKIAFDLLSPILFLQKSLDIPYCHHERWDGAGYPRGLEGEEIPLAARIFSVVDNFDAMTSDRPYRAALSVSFTLKYISEQSGRMFDPTVVDAFLKMFRKLS